jgi:hypothetical protein
METVIPCSDDFRHPDGTVVTLRLLPHLFFSEDGSSTYPRSSPLRCHSCLLHFPGAPLFLASSIQYHPVGGGMTIEVTGHYCSAGCRNRGLDDMDGVQAETYRLNTVRADMEAFGRMLDYMAAGPLPRELDVFGGKLAREPPVGAPACRDGGAPIRWVYRLRGVRETWFGKLEGGEGREAILEALAGEEGLVPIDANHERLRDPDALAAFLATQPGSPRLAVEGGRNLASWPRISDACGERLCWWCAGRIDPELPFMVPRHRDLLNTVHLEGWFCTPGCGLAWLTSARRGLSPTRHHERIGLYVWLCTSVIGIPLRARPRIAPHRLELAEFGGDLTREEFRAQERREDLFTSLEEPPAVSRRMLGNYTRPGVVCDLTRLGDASGPVIIDSGADSGTASAMRQHGEAPGMFEELVREYKPPQPAAAPPKRKPGVLVHVVPRDGE